MILSDMARRILTAFAQAYPQSAQYRGGRTLRLADWQRRIPELAVAAKPSAPELTDPEQKEAFLHAVDDLASAGVISVKWRRFRTGEELEALYLEDPAQLYSLLGLDSPEQQREAAQAALDREPWTHPRLAVLRTHLLSAIEAHQALPAMDPDDLHDIGRLFLLDPARTIGTPMRALSIELFADSKRLERLLPAADRISSFESAAAPETGPAYNGGERSSPGPALSQKLGLERSYPEVSLALVGELHVPGDSWHMRGDIISLPESTLAGVTSASLKRPHGAPDTWICTVENKESFHAVAAAARQAWDDEGWTADSTVSPPSPSAIVYTAGYPAGVVCKAVSLLGADGARVAHFGDMDPEGLLILQQLSSCTGCAVEPLAMSAKLYHQNLRYGRALTPASLRRLPEVQHPELQELAALIAEHRVGVEQELIALRFGQE